MTNYGCSTLKKDEVTSKFPGLLMEVFAVLQEKIKIKKEKKRKIVLKMYRSSPIFWLFTACFIKYFDNVDVYTLHDIRVPPVMHKHVQYGHS